jgi:hypothetical protein
MTGFDARKQGVEGNSADGTGTFQKNYKRLILARVTGVRKVCGLGFSTADWPAVKRVMRQASFMP